MPPGTPNWHPILKKWEAHTRIGNVWEYPPPPPYRTCIKVVRFLDSSDISFHFLRSGPPYKPVLFTLTLSHIIATRVGLDLSRCMSRIFNKIHRGTSAIKRLATKRDLSPFKIDSAVVDSNRSVNLLFSIRKILCTYPRKGKDIRVIQKFQIGDLSSFLAGGLTCIRRGDLFVSWSGCREDQTP